MSVSRRADDDHAVALAVILAVMFAAIAFVVASSHYIC